MDVALVFKLGRRLWLHGWVGVHTYVIAQMYLRGYSIFALCLNSRCESFFVVLLGHSKIKTTMHEPLLTLYTDIVRPAWIDYNGHMNDGYYAVAFSFVTDAFMDYIGIGAAYRTQTRCTIYTAEMHITYLRELKEQAPLQFTTQILAFDAKRCHIFHSLLHGTEQYLAATCELMQLHVDQALGKVVSFPDSVMNRLAELYAVHENLPKPVQVGHVMKLQRK